MVSKTNTLPTLAGLAAVAAVGLIGGVAVTRGPRTLLVASAAVVLMAVVGWLAVAPRPRMARGAVWVAYAGLLTPVAVVQQKTAEQINATGGITAVTVGEQAVSIACLVVVLALARPRILPLRNAEPWLAVYLAFAAASSLWSVGGLPTVLKAGQLCVAYGLVLAVVRLRGRAAMDDVIGLLHVVLLAALAAILVAPNKALVDTELATPVHRLHGVLPSAAPDLLGIVAAVAIVALAGGLGPRWTTRWPALRIGLILAYTAVLLLARARSPLVLVAVGLVLVFVQSSSGRLKSVALVPLAAMGSLAAYVVFAPTVTAFIQRGQSAQQLSSLTGRTNVWTLALNQWQSRPWTGYGYYSGHRLGAALDVLYHQHTNLDNLWVETLLDVGLVGTALLALFVVFGMRAALSRRQRSLAGGGPAAAVIITLFLASFIDPSLQQPTYTMFAFATFLLAAALSAEDGEAREPDQGRIHTVDGTLSSV